MNHLTLMKLVLGDGIPEGLMDHIQELRDADFRKNTSLDREGDKLTVPKSMTLQDAVTFLEGKIAEEETPVKIHETIEAFPFDAAHALTLVIKEMFGFSGSEPTTVETMFGPITYAPTFVPVEISHEAKVQVPWGQFTIPGIDGSLKTGFAKKDDRVIFTLSGEVKGKHKSIVMELAQAVRAKLKTASIYRGKAIKVAFRDKDGKKIFFDPSITPEFMNLDGNEVPIFNKITEDQIALSIYNPIEHTERLRKHNVKIKRTVLLEGDFGTGKTLTALQTARKCATNGWTFLYVVDCRDLDVAMKLAEQYAPAVVFAEDTDRVMGGDRDEEMDRLSYVLDGVDTKAKELIVILTTNNIKDIQKLMLRPGRTDAVVSIQPPDADTVYRLMANFAKGRLIGDEKDFRAAIKPMVGQNPAFIQEVVSKAELCSIGRGDEIKIEPNDIAVAVALMKTHVDLMKDDEESSEVRIPFKDAMLTYDPSSNGNGELIPAGTDEEDDE